MQESQVRSLGWEDALEKRMAASILTWRTPWTEEPGGLQSAGSQRGGHHWATDPTLKRFKPMLLLRKIVTDRKLAKPIFIKSLLLNPCKKPAMDWMSVPPSPNSYDETVFPSVMSAAHNTI